MTLLEVMAAVALLGILYTFLAKAATQGVRSEAESRRRMEASLLADATLAEIETRLALGETLQLENSEREEDDFLISVEITPFELPAELAGGTAAAAGAAAPSPLGAANADAPNLLQRVEVRVAWKDGIFERSAERVTFAIDAEAAQAVAQALAQAQTPTGGLEALPGGLEVPTGVDR